MNRRQRLETAVSRGVPDRVPVSAWGHFYPQETTAHGLATVMIDFRDLYDWDYLKIHARASYHVEGWGFRFEASTEAAVGHRCIGHPIDGPQAWRKLAPLGLDCAPLAEQRLVVSEIRKRLPSDVPLIMTVFSPLDVAEKLIDRDAALLKSHIENDPESLEMGLSAIADTFARFVRQLVSDGIDGIFFSTKWANNVKLTPQQYGRLVRPFDLQVLSEARSLWCNMLHLCEDEIQLDAMADYPVQVFHWDDHAGHNPTLAVGRDQVGGAVGGGVDARTLANAGPDDVLHRARSAIEQTQARGLLLGPGCSVQIARTSHENLRALRRSVEL